MRVRQIDNLLDLIELFAREREPMTLTALAAALGMPKSSTFNMIETLVARGFLYETKQRGGYYPTRRLFEVARAIMDGDPFLERIHGELEALAETTGETVLLATRDHDHVIYVDVVESPAFIRYFAKVGDRRPVYTTSSGKAILASYPDAERAEILKRLTFVAHRETTRKNADELEAELMAAMGRGWTEDLAEFTPDVMGMGIPVMTGERRFGLAVAGPLYRMYENRSRLGAQLRATAEKIGRISWNGGD